jgi:hypothetical protein
MRLLGQPLAKRLRRTGASIEGARTHDGDDPSPWCEQRRSVAHMGDILFLFERRIHHNTIKMDRWVPSLWERQKIVRTHGVAFEC